MEEEQKNISGTDAASVAKDENREDAGRLHRERRRCDFGRILIGAMVILFGVIVLAKNSGFLPDYVYFDFAKFWPLLIVALGLSLLDTRNRFYYAVGFAVLIMVTILLAMSLRGMTTREAEGVPIIRGQVILPAETTFSATAGGRGFAPSQVR